jgi:hypothetical protein
MSKPFNRPVKSSIMKRDTGNVTPHNADVMMMRMIGIEALTHTLPVPTTVDHIRRRWVADGNLPARSVGGRWFIDPADVVAMILATRSGPPGLEPSGLGAFVGERQAAARLDVALVTLRRWRGAGTLPIPAYRLGRATLYVAADLDALVATQRAVAA